MVEWFTLADYLDAKETATYDIIARYARGNIAIQNGAFLDKDKLDRLSKKGDEAMANLSKMIPADAR